MKFLFTFLAVCGPGLAMAAGVLEVSAPGYGFQNAEYTTSHVFIDEVAGTTADIEIRFDPQAAGTVTDVEVFTNLNRRDLATTDKNTDGVHDGILPPDGNAITDSAGDTDPSTGHYYIPHNMSFDGGLGLWTLTIPASKTGSYRLTARFKENGNPNWQWYGLRDHCVVVSPVTARDIRLYELNVLYAEASGTLESQRSTWEDLSDRVGAIHTAPGRDNDWSLATMADLGVNWLWFQPYHPYGVDGRIAGGTTKVWNGSSYDTVGGYSYALGSPYSVKNYWEIEPRTSAQYNSGDSLALQRSKAMTSFQNFVADADAAGVQIMPDAAFNHTAFDVELGQEGVDIWSGGGGWSPSDEIRSREVRIFSREDDYYQRAGLGPTEAIAPAPDRYDFGKWNDVKDIYFGRYAALWRNGSSTEKQKDEGDWFDFTTHGFNGTDGGSFDSITRGVWMYFGAYVPYWIEKTRPPGENRNSLPSDGDAAVRYAWDARGIDGLRCDFGQGLPPRCWEYIINRAKSTKWNFVFMSESLDGGEVTYRSGRHFDVLNENLLFDVRVAGNATDLEGAYEARRTAYGQTPVLLNTTSHDEENYGDPWRAFSHFAANSTIDGAPMIFAGQELGLTGIDGGGSNFGYDLLVGAGKEVPLFFHYNSMMPAWSDSNFWNDQLSIAYASINHARMESPALRSPNRWFLNGDGSNDNIFAVAKFEEANAPANLQDVVFCFVNLDLGGDQDDNFKVDSGLATLIGLDDARLYNIANIAAYERPPAVTNRRNQLLWGSPISGASLKSSGFTVFLKRVPASVGAWDTAPYEAQYLKLIDVTDPLEVEVTNIEVIAPDVEVTCTTTVGRYYQLETSPTGLPGSWTTVVSNVEATGSSLVLTHSGGAGTPGRLYRVRVSYLEL